MSEGVSPATPTLQDSKTPRLQDSKTPTLQHSNTPTLQHSNTGSLSPCHSLRNSMSSGNGPKMGLLCLRYCRRNAVGLLQQKQAYGSVLTRPDQCVRQYSSQFENNYFVFKAHRLCVSLNSRLARNKEEEESGKQSGGRECPLAPPPSLGSIASLGSISEAARSTLHPDMACCHARVIEWVNRFKPVFKHVLNF